MRHLLVVRRIPTSDKYKPVGLATPAFVDARYAASEDGMKRRLSSAVAIGTVLAAWGAFPAASRAQRSAPGSPSADTFDVVEKTIPELQDAMTSRSVTSKQLVAAHLARIAAYDQPGP